MSAGQKGEGRAKTQTKVDPLFRSDVVKAEKDFNLQVDDYAHARQRLAIHLCPIPVFNAISSHLGIFY